MNSNFDETKTTADILPEYDFTREYPTDELLDALGLDHGRSVNSRGELVWLLNKWYHGRINERDRSTLQQEALESKSSAESLLDAWGDTSSDALVAELSEFIVDYVKTALENMKK